jgi:hypothetical protein
LLSEEQELLRDNDALLQASRRLDWRFLLPEPELGRVACIGVDDPNLAESLRLFGSEATVLEAGRPWEELALHDVVVLRNPAGAELAAAVPLLRPGGWMYVEVDGAGGRRRLLGSRRTARGYAAALRRLGLVEVQGHLHWPDFRSCRVIVPLGDALAVRLALARRRQNASARLVVRLAPLLAACNLLAAVAPSASVLARRPARAGEEGRA